MKPIVVLNEPQNLVNVAVVIRAMLNFDVPRLRVVAPAEWDARRIEGIAHKSGPIIERTGIYDTLDTCLADCTFVLGLTARGRAHKRNALRPRDAMREVRELDAGHQVAFLFGREDKGLSNEDLDRCHRTVTIPTSAEFPSLNLAQAATLTLYSWFEATTEAPPLKRPRRDAPPAAREQLEGLFEDAERALEGIEFFKSHTQAAMMRTVREVLHRASLDSREANLARAMCREVLNYLERKGVGTA